MQKIARLLFALFALLALQTSPLTAQNYSGPVPIQDFHRHHGYDPIYTFGPVAEGDTLAWIRD